MSRRAVWAILGLLATLPAEASSVQTREVGPQGWTLVTEQDPQALVSRITIVVRSGGLSDPAGLPGVANFTARALLRGTRTRPFKDLTDSIERMGATVSVGADLTQTVISATVLSRNFDSFLDILRDVLTQPAFDAREMVALQTVLQGERKSRLQDPRTVAARASLEKAYAGTPAALPPIGTQDSIARLSPQDAQAFFKARYVRENMVIAVSSPDTAEQTAVRLAAKLDALPHGDLDARHLPASALSGRHAVIVDRKGMATVPLYIAVPGVAAADPDLPALEVGNYIFGADFTSRLMQVLRVEHGWTYGAYSGYEQLMGAKADPTLFSLYTFPSAEFAAPAIPEALKQLDLYVKQGISADEFAIARDALGNSYPFELDTAGKRLGLRLREVLNGRAYETTAQYRARLGAMTLADVNAVIARRTPTADMVIATVGDAAVLKPILAALDLVESVEVLDVQR